MKRYQLRVWRRVPSILKGLSLLEVGFWAGHLVRLEEEAERTRGRV
jgi:hypothetical protein